MHHICCTVASFYQISGLTNILLLLLSSWIFSVHWFSRIMSYFRCHPLPFSDQSSPCAIIASASIIHYIWPYSFHFLLRKSLTLKGRRTKATERDILVVRCCHNTIFPVLVNMPQIPLTNHPFQVSLMHVLFQQLPRNDCAWEVSKVSSKLSNLNC